MFREEPIWAENLQPDISLLFCVKCSWFSIYVYCI